MISDLLKAQLEPVARRQRRVALRWKLTACWLGAALLGLGIGGWMPKLALPLTLVLGIGAAIVVAIRHSRTKPDWHALARRIEAAHPALDGRLLTGVEQEAEDGRHFNYLQERLLIETALLSQKQDWLTAIPKSRAALARAAHWLAIILFGIAVWQLRVTGGRGVFVRYPERGITVTPGDTSIERGNSLVVLARFGGALPPTVELVIEPSPGTTKRIPLVKSLADPMFGGSLPEVVSNFTYHIEYGGQRTRDFAVTVFEYPRLERADADLTYPDYTGQPANHVDNTRRLTAVEGSRLDLALQLNKPVVSARLVPRTRDADAVALLVETNRPAAALRQFTLAASRTYELQLVDAEGRTNKTPAQFVFAVLTNRAPELRLASPRGDMRPSPLEEITFEGTVWDDFGVKEYGLGYTIAGQDTKFIELGRGVPAKEKRSFQYLLRLEDIGAQPDELISWFAWADDIGSDGQVRRTPGDLFFGEVRPFEEIFREGQGMNGDEAQNQQGGSQGQQGGDRTGQLTDLQKQIISATWKLQRDHGGARIPAPAPPAKPAGGATPAPKQSAPTSGSAVAPVNILRPFAGQVAPGSAGPRRGARPARTPGNSDPAPTGGSAPPKYEDDVGVVRDSQAEALDQTKTALEQQQDPRTAALWSAAAKQMEEALARLQKAADSPAELAAALAAEQAAYQALLKVQQHEYQVARSRNQNRGQSGSSRQQQMQRQLDELDLTQSENRYETQRQAQAPQSAQRREQLQVMNRLQELARRQQDLNDRLKELQTALQEARTQQEREDIQRRLQRLQEEEQQMLADVDELRQRMDRPENQSQMADERRQLDQTREDVQRAAEAAGQDAPSQALASGTRAQRQLQQLRDQMRRENSSQFSDEMRDMRNDARELARQQEDILQKMEQETSSEHRSLSDSTRQDTLEQLARQRQRMTNLVERATRTSQEAETAEPLLSQQLYDTVRQFSQDSAQNLKEVQDQLLERGLMPRNLYERLKDESVPDGSKLLDVTSEMLRLGLLPPANDTAQRSGATINNLKRGVERAAESVLGDDTEALRLARQELDQLTDQLRREMTQAGSSNAPTNQAASLASRSGRPSTNELASAQNRDAQSPRSVQPTNQIAQAEDENRNPSAAGQPGSRENTSARDGQSQSADPQTASADSNQRGGTQAGNRDGQPSDRTGENAPGQRDGQSQIAQAGQDRPTPGSAAERAGTRTGQRDGGAQTGGEGGGNNWGDRLGNLLDQVANDDGRAWGGPLTSEYFLPWSDRLRDVEEMIELPDLRNQVASARDRARVLRQQFKTTGRKPDWAVVQLQVVKPLVEVRDRIAEELARRGSEQALVPIDRDPVPNRYSDLVRRYYEELGKGK